MGACASVRGRGSNLASSSVVPQPIGDDSGLVLVPTSSQRQQQQQQLRQEPRDNVTISTTGLDARLGGSGAQGSSSSGILGVSSKSARSQVAPAPPSLPTGTSNTSTGTSTSNTGANSTRDGIDSNNSNKGGNTATREVVESSGLVYSDANVNANSANLVAAAKLGDIASVKRIIASGCDVNKRGMWNNTPLIVSCQYNHPEVCKLLLNQPGIDVTLHNEKGVTALLCACLEGMEIAIIRDLIAKGASVAPKGASIYNSMTDRTGSYSPISAAIVNGHISVVEELLLNGLNRNEVVTNPMDKTNPPTEVSLIMLACLFNRPEILRLLVVKYGASLDGIDATGNTTQHYVCKNNSKNIDQLVDCIEQLGGFDCISNSSERKLIDVLNDGGDTPLILAADINVPYLVKKLLDHGANPNISNKQGATALHNAMKRRSEEVVALLLKAGADVYIKDHKGISSLDSALKLKADAPIRKLIEDHVKTSTSTEGIITSESKVDTCDVPLAPPSISMAGFVLPTCPSVGAIVLTHEILHAPAHIQPDSDANPRKPDSQINNKSNIPSLLSTTIAPPVNISSNAASIDIYNNNDDDRFGADEVRPAGATVGHNPTPPISYNGGSNSDSISKAISDWVPNTASTDMSTPPRGASLRLGADGTGAEATAAGVNGSTLGVYDASSALRFVMPYTHEDYLPSPVVLFK